MEVNVTATSTPNVFNVTVAQSGSGGQGPKGDPGKSAYEIAVDNGFVGTEQQWLDSLEGPPGPAGTTDYNELDNKPTLGTAAAADVTDFATAEQGAKADSALQSVQAGDNITIDNTDPNNPVISATSSVSSETDWGDIGGTLSDQTDIQDALNGKATAAQGALADTAVQPDDILTGGEPAEDLVTGYLEGTLYNLSGSVPFNRSSTSSINGSVDLIAVSANEWIAIAGIAASLSNTNLAVVYTSEGARVSNMDIDALVAIEGGHKVQMGTNSNIAFIGFNLRNADLPNIHVYRGEEVAPDTGPKIKKDLIPKIDWQLLTRSYLANTWNAVGTSITYNDGRTYPSAAGPLEGTPVIGYQSLIQKQISFGTYRNYGYSGYSYGVGTSGNVITNNMTSWLAADIWTIEGPTNDFRLEVPLGAESDFTGNTGNTTFFGAMRAVVDRIYQLSSSARLIFISDPQRNNSGYSSFSPNTGGHTLEDYTEAMKWVAGRYGSPFVDVFHESGINAGNMGTYLYDGLHPNNDGYRLMYLLLINRMLAL